MTKRILIIMKRILAILLLSALCACAQTFPVKTNSSGAVTEPAALVGQNLSPTGSVTFGNVKVSSAAADFTYLSIKNTGGGHEYYLRALAPSTAFDIYDASEGLELEAFSSSGQPIFPYFSSAGVIVTDASGKLSTTNTLALDLGSGALPTSISASARPLQIASNNTGCALESFGWGSSGLAIWGRAAGGTRASPSATAADQTIVGINGFGYDTAYVTSVSGALSVKADGLWSVSNRGTYWQWTGTLPNTTANQEWMRLQNAKLLITASSGGGIGYGTGSGGAVTQITSRTTGVTLNTPTGAITLVSAAGSASYQTFTVTDSAVAATDTISINQKSGTDIYIITIHAVAAGSFQVSYATTGGTTTEQPVFQFNVIKGANS